MKVLLVVSHPDDEILGFGASAYKLSKDGHEIYSCILSGEVEARTQRPDLSQLNSNILAAQKIVGIKETIQGSFPNIRLNTVPHIELVQFIERAILQTNATHIFTHHPNDLNDDHRHTSIATQAAARIFQRKNDTKRLRGLYYMEVLSATDWAFPNSNSQFKPTSYLEVGIEGVNAKINALKEYKNIMRPYPHPRCGETIKALATLRGSQAGQNYSESFELAFNDLNNTFR